MIVGAAGSLEPRVVPVPEAVDREVARLDAAIEEVRSAIDALVERGERRVGAFIARHGAAAPFRGRRPVREDAP